MQLSKNLCTVIRENCTVKIRESNGVAINIETMFCRIFILRFMSDGCFKHISFNLLNEIHKYGVKHI